MSHKKKSLFNAIITGSSMVLGMSITEGFKCMAVDIRWWVLSRKKRRLSKVDKILRADSLTVLGELFMTYIWRNVRSCHLFRDWGLILGIAIWWSAQVAIASVGLTYSVDQLGSIAQTKQGFVLLPNMTQIFPVGIQDSGSTKAQQNTANRLFWEHGFEFRNRFCQQYPPPGTLLSSINALFFWSIDENSGVFVFIDSSPSDPGFANYTGGPSAMFTNRKINSTYSCLSFPVIGGGNGTVGNLTVLKNSNEDSFNVFLPIVPGLDTTTYFTNPVSRCGDGCSIVEAFEASYNTSWYYQCNITVGTVVNAMIPEHEVGLNLREMASGGIALQGYGPNSHLPESKQFQVYPSASPYGVPQKGDTDKMGRNIALFAIGVVSMAALYTSHTVNVTGLQPHIGHELKVNHWNLICIIIGLIVGVQGAAFVLTRLRGG
ncbi:hypothetical protein B0J14DRAFT_496881 [Halenospora varia]|nr:hypothetical protein B0J14DRAFT_496881 [Halenospora varia]